jgi:hypothetical protein
MVFNTITKIILLPIYYIIHHNYIFGFIHKYFIKKFHYKKYTFNLNIKSIPLQNYSSFLFKTYEFNDRSLIERNITTRNKCVVLGGGIGFIPTLTYSKSKKKVLVFEINKSILKNLRDNLIGNKVKYKIFNNNLVFQKTNNKFFYFTNDFLSTSSKVFTKKKILVKNIIANKIKEFESYNTLIIDVEGDEDYYIHNIKMFKNIKYLVFELHHNIFNEYKIKKMMNALKYQKFFLKDKCFNSYYFIKKNK